MKKLVAIVILLCWIPIAIFVPSAWAGTFLRVLATPFSNF